MNYRLVVSAEAYEDLDRYVEYIATDLQSPLVASRWMEKSVAALRTLKTFPNRCPTAPESQNSRFEIRMLMVDHCLFVYRVDEEDKVVRVLRFRHGGRKPFELE